MKTEYKGYEIRYCETFEQFDCSELSLKHDKLSGLKKKIDKTFLDERKTCAVQCLAEDGYGDKDLIPATIIGIMSDFKEGDGRAFSRSKNDEPVKVYYTRVKKGSNRPSRSSIEIGGLFRNTPEAKQALEYAKLKKIEAKAASTAAHNAWRAIPRMNQDDVTELLEIFRKDKSA